MKVNMNIIVGGTDDILDDILSAARTVRKEMKKTFENIEIETLQKMDICVCLSGNVSKYYPESGIYQARYYSKRGNLWYMFISALMSGIPIRQKV